MRTSSSVATGTSLRRAGEPWTDNEDRELVRELQDGLALEDIAGGHGRTVGAISSRADRMVPHDEQHPTGHKARLDWLRKQLLVGDYDWQTPLQSQDGLSAWSAEDDERLRMGWNRRTRLVDLAYDLQRSEPMLLRRLVQLRIAHNLDEVVDRLGCAPDGPLATRQAVERGAGPVIHVLVGLHDDGGPLHVSFHESADAAQAMARAIDDRDGGGRTWHVTALQVGGPGYADALVGFEVKGDIDIQQ